MVANTNGAPRVHLWKWAIVTLMLIGCAGAALFMFSVNSSIGNLTDEAADSDKIVRGRFFASAEELFKPVVQIVTSSPDFEEEYLETAFLKDDSTLITVAHGLKELREKSDKLEIKIYKRVIFLFLPGQPEITLEEEPIYSENQLFAFYKLPKDFSERLEKFHIPHLKIAQMNKVYFGQLALRMTANEKRLYLSGSYVVVTHIEFDGWRNSNIGNHEVDLPDVSMLLASIGVPYGMEGDSGSPVVVFDKDLGKFVLVGITETPIFALRADLLDEFLKSHGIE